MAAQAGGEPGWQVNGKARHRQDRPRPPLMRRQLTLFLPGAARAIVEPIRLRLDPLQYALIPAHVTLCRDEELPPWPLLSARLAALGRFSLSLRFGRPEQLADGCVLLRLVQGSEPYQQLRQAMLGPAARLHGAHITLLHPRNAKGVSCNLADLGPVLDGIDIQFNSLALIEQLGQESWRVRQVYGAGQRLGCFP